MALGIQQGSLESPFLEFSLSLMGWSLSTLEILPSSSAELPAKVVRAHFSSAHRTYGTVMLLQGHQSQLTQDQHSSALIFCFTPLLCGRNTSFHCCLDIFPQDTHIILYLPSLTSLLKEVSMREVFSVDPM
ncbi:hypothetical protein H1C71_014390 [Ictidomys tridecemlineatus]|nr:hypothetical protein H1C71_014390 [Ictidomys tridecemlineatus]